MKDTCYFSLLAVIFFGLCVPSGVLFAAVQDETATEQALPEVISDFKTCAIVGLQRTPELKRTRMEIDIRRLDEDDSRWSYVPSLRLSSRYYFTENEADISFNAVNYRPWEPYYSLQARKLITGIVTLTHVKATAEALHKLAARLLEFNAYLEIDEEYKKIVDLHEKKLKYAEKRRQTQTTASIEYEIEKQTLDYLRAEKEGNLVHGKALIDGLCIMMNLPDPGIFNLDREAVLSQILGSGEIPGQVDQAPPDQSFDKRIMALKLLLQEKNILLAYSRYMPDFSMGVRSPDVLNVSVDEDSDYFFYIGMDLTLWDGKKRSHDITRQQMLLRQLRLETREVENSDSIEWLQASRKFTVARTEFDLSQSVVKLKMLELKKKEFDYGRGIIRLPQLLDHQVEIHREKINALHKKLELQKSMLQLRHLSGQLLRDTVNVSLPEIPND